MDFISLRFNVFVIAALAAFYLCPRRRRAGLVLPVIDIIFISAFVTSPAQLLPLALFLLAGFVCLKMIEAKPTRGRVISSIAVMAALFVYLKKYSFMAFAPFIGYPYLVVGMSYILFRVLHLFVDVYGGAIKKRFSGLEFFNYNCFFLNFISGPIQRFQEYAEQEETLQDHGISKKDAYNSFSRIINGYLKIAVLSTIFLSIHNTFFRRVDFTGHDFNTMNLMVIYSGACFSYTLYFYYNFAGYMDVVIGVGRLFGFKLPENFDHPFSAESFLEFWSRWHITLANWFKFYIFNPLVKAFAHRWPDSGLSAYYGVAAFFVTFFLMGIWHGSSAIFLVYGLFLALGVSLNKLYDVFMKAALGRSAYNSLSGNRLYRLAGSALTYSYFSIALTCLWVDFKTLIWLFDKIGLIGFVTVFIAGGMLAALVMASIKAMARLKGGFSERSRHVWNNFYFQQGYLSFKAFILVLVASSKVLVIPEFVYKAF